MDHIFILAIELPGRVISIITSNKIKQDKIRKNWYFITLATTIINIFVIKDPKIFFFPKNFNY